MRAISEGRAVVRRGSGATLASHVVRSPRAGESVVRVELAGICRTDLQAASGTLEVADGRVLGHELAGRVVSSARWPEGTRVTAVPAIACGQCAAPQGSRDATSCAERPERCASPLRVGVDVDGAFATFVVLPDACLCAVPPSLGDREAAFVEPMAAALAVTRVIAPHERVVVMGSGRIATLVARVAGAHRGHEVVALGPDELARDGRYDVVIETEPEALDHALAAVRPGGRVVLKSRPASRVPLDVSLAVQREVSLVAVRYAPFADAIGWLVERRVAIDDLLGETYPLARFSDALALAAGARARKVFLAPGAE